MILLGKNYHLGKRNSKYLGFKILVFPYIYIIINFTKLFKISIIKKWQDHPFILIAGTTNHLRELYQYFCVKQKDEERTFCVKFITLLQITISVVYKFNKEMSLKLYIKFYTILQIKTMRTSSILFLNPRSQCSIRIAPLSEIIENSYLEEYCFI